MSTLAQQINTFLYRRSPYFDQEFEQDRFPLNDAYLGIYPTKPWDPFTLATHNYELVHITMPNDDGCWDAVDDTSWTNGDCTKAPLCNPTRLELGWGATNRTYIKYHRDYTTKPLCFDQLRHIPAVRDQLGIIVDTLKQLPAVIQSDFQRLLALRQADFIYVCGTSLNKVTVSDSIFTNQCQKINLGSANNRPTSKLSLQYLNHFVGELMYKGYFNKKFMDADTPDHGLPGKFTIMTDFQTQSELCNANQALTQMYNAADFQKGGKFFGYGAMAGCGEWLFRIDPTPLRFTDMGGGILQRIYPFQNVSATVGKKPQFDPNYEAAAYQLSHVYCRAARTVMAGETASVNGDMPYPNRNLMGKWSWKTPDVIIYRNPTDGSSNTINNDKQNWGYFLGEFEAGMKSVHPEIELWVLHLREASPFADIPRNAAITWPTSDGSAYQSLTPYNPGCDTSELV